MCRLPRQRAGHLPGGRGHRAAVFARCGLCGKVFCEYNNHMTVNHLCWECQTAIEQNVDCNEEIIDPDLFRNLFTNK